ncbi:MAG: MarR family winged helix-turn-helix transcriptional regulator, partial [bacterium]
AKSIATIEDKGYIKRRKNADDGRSQIIVFTPKGMRLLQTCITAISQIESIYEAKLGKKSFTELKSSIAQLIKIYETK